MKILKILTLLFASLLTLFLFTVVSYYFLDSFLGLLAANAMFGAALGFLLYWVIAEEIE